MVDKRPFAKIDTGYHMNLKWYQIQRAMQDAMPNAMPNAIRHAMRLCRDAHHASILYCRQNGTDGMFPVAAIKLLVSVLDDEEDAALTFLFDSGMWINHPGGMAEVRDYLEHQTPSDEMKTRSDAARKAAKARWSKHADRNADRNAERIDDAQCREEERREEKEVARADVLEILDYLDSKLLTLEVKLPNRNKTNLQEARRLLDVDHKTVTQVKACIDYAMDDPFWSTTCLSIKSLRKSYDRISLQARGKQNTRQAVPALVRAGDLDD